MSKSMETFLALFSAWGLVWGRALSMVTCTFSSHVQVCCTYLLGNTSAHFPHVGRTQHSSSSSSPSAAERTADESTSVLERIFAFIQSHQGKNRHSLLQKCCSEKRFSLFLGLLLLLGLDTSTVHAPYSSSPFSGM